MQNSEKLYDQRTMWSPDQIKTWHCDDNIINLLESNLYKQKSNSSSDLMDA